MVFDTKNSSAINQSSTAYCQSFCFIWVKTASPSNYYWAQYFAAWMCAIMLKLNKNWRVFYYSKMLLGLNEMRLAHRRPDNKWWKRCNVFHVTSKWRKNCQHYPLQISARDMFLFLCIFPSKKLYVNEDFLNIFPFIDFNYSYYTCMCSFTKFFKTKKAAYIHFFF